MSINKITLGFNVGVGCECIVSDREACTVPAFSCALAAAGAGGAVIALSAAY